MIGQTIVRAAARLAIGGALLASATLTTTSVSAQNFAQLDRGGAIAANAVAVSRGGQRWGVGYALGGERWSAVSDAARRAMARCARHDCRVQFQSVNPEDRCTALARSASGYGIGVGASAQSARSQAIAVCGGNAACRVTGESCGD